MKEGFAWLRIEIMMRRRKIEFWHKFTRDISMKSLLLLLIIWFIFSGCSVIDEIVNDSTRKPNKEYRCVKSPEYDYYANKKYKTF